MERRLKTDSSEGDTQASMLLSAGDLKLEIFSSELDLTAR